jgi:hypothetical protein
MTNFVDSQLDPHGAPEASTTLFLSYVYLFSKNKEVILCT